MNDAFLGTPETVRIRASAWPRPLRPLFAGLYLASRIAPVVILGMLLLGLGETVSPARLVRLLAYWVLLPTGALALLNACFAAHLEIRGHEIVLVHRGLFRRRRAIAVSAPAGVTLTSWRLPFPSPGLSVAGGKHWAGLAIACWNPAVVITASRKAGVSVSETSTSRATLTYAMARDAAGRMRWPGYLFKFVLFPLLPAFIFFRLHQWVMYGGLLGQYYLHGLQPWLSSFVFHWIMSCCYLLLYASLWRGPAEMVAYLLAARTPEKALPARRWTERVLAILYFGGVPLLVAARFLA